MVRGMFIALMTAITFFTGSILPAHAGGMGRGSGGAFVCYLASGDSPGGSIQDLSDDFFSGETARDVKLGAVRFVCTPVTGGTRIGTKVNPPASCEDTAAGDPCADHLVCYNILSSKGDNPSTLVNMHDKFFATTTDAVGGAQVLCVGAERLADPQP